jgi:hypothetical protein
VGAAVSDRPHTPDAFAEWWVKRLEANRKPDQFMPFQPNRADLIDAVKAGWNEGKWEHAG